MRKKRSKKSISPSATIFIIIISALFILNIVEKSLESSLEESVSEGSQIQGMSVKNIELPAAVKKALEDQSKRNLALKQQKEQMKQAKVDNEVRIVKVISLILAISLLLLSLVTKGRIYSLRRELRRKFLYLYINKYHRQGKDYKEIESLLIDKGFDEEHVCDAVTIYETNHGIK